MIRLTKKEEEIMEIFWNSEESLSSNDVKSINENLSIHTIQQVLRRLNDKGYLKIDGIGFTKNSITRKFKVVIPQSEYLKAFIAKKTSLELALAFIEENNDIEVINELDELLQKKRKDLMEK